MDARVDQFTQDTWDYYNAVKLGKIKDQSIVNKFGEALDIDTGTAPMDIWDLNKLYVFSDEPDINSLSSSDPNFNGDVEVTGLDENWDEVVQTVTAEGQNTVQLEIPLIRSYRMRNISNTNLSASTDSIELYTNGAAVVGGVPSDPNQIRARIQGFNNQTMMCIFSSARNCEHIIKEYDASIVRTQNVTALMSVLVREFGQVFAVKARFGLDSSASSDKNRQYRVGGITVGEKADIIMRCEAVSANGVHVTGELDIYRQKNGQSDYTHLFD